MVTVAEAGRNPRLPQRPERCAATLVRGVYLSLPGLLQTDHATLSHKLTRRYARIWHGWGW